VGNFGVVTEFTYRLRALSDSGLDASLPHWREAYYGSNHLRLLAMRELVDPFRYFKFPQAI
jgi:hypothetical protein